MSLRPQVELEEAVVRRRAAGRTLGQEARVWLVRVLVNLLVLVLLGAAFYGVYWATGETGQLQVGPGDSRPASPQMEGYGPRQRPSLPGISGRRHGVGVGLDFRVSRKQEAGQDRVLAVSLAHPRSPQEKPLVQQTPLLQLLVSYLPSIFISVVNFVLPPVFKLIGPLESYTRSRQIVLILLRFRPEGWAGIPRRGDLADGDPGSPGVTEPRFPHP